MKKPTPNEPQPLNRPVAIPDLSSENEFETIVRHMLKKCARTLNEDLEALSPRDRIMLWKEYGSYFDRPVQDNSDVPGSDVRTVTIKILTQGEDGHESA